MSSLYLLESMFTMFLVTKKAKVAENLKPSRQKKRENILQKICIGRYLSSNGTLAFTKHYPLVMQLFYSYAGRNLPRVTEDFKQRSYTFGEYLERSEVFRKIRNVRYIV